MTENYDGLLESLERLAGDRRLKGDYQIFESTYDNCFTIFLDVNQRNHPEIAHSPRDLEALLVGELPYEEEEPSLSDDEEGYWIAPAVEIPENPEPEKLEDCFQTIKTRVDTVDEYLKEMKKKSRETSEELLEELDDEILEGEEE